MVILICDLFHEHLPCKGRTHLYIIIIIIIITKLGSASQRESDLHPIGPRPADPQYQPGDRKKKLGK